MTSGVGARSRQLELGEAFEAIYAEQFAFVWRSLLHLGVRPAHAEDAAQEVFIVVHRRLDTWDQAVSARSWLYGICRRVAAGQRRAQHRHRRKLAALPRPGGGPALDGQVADRQLLARLERVLHALEPGTREAYVMAELEGMSCREISEATGVNANTVYSRLRKARVALRTSFGEPDPDPPEGGSP